VLSLYSRAPAAFDSDDSVIATAYAHHAGLVYAQHEVAANLRVALETREAVGRAVGILMERYRLPATAAFDRLVAVSQQSHRKLRDVALRVVETGEDPEMIVVPPLG
jgi:AmiR/NasT family two-component response regulator